MNHKLRVLYVQSPYYDFVTASLLQGLVHLEKAGSIHLATTERSNYAKREHQWHLNRIIRHKRDFDIAILGTNRGVSIRAFETVEPYTATVCVDGSDGRPLAHCPGRFSLYSKREVFKDEQLPEGVLPCPIAVEDRWWQEPSSSPEIAISACFAKRPGIRSEVLTAIEALQLDNVYVGSVRPTLVDRIKGVLMGQCALGSAFKQRFAVGHNLQYLSVLNNSLMSLSLPGFGWDTGRWWEILGSGAALVSPEPLIHMPSPFKPGTHFLLLESASDLVEIAELAKSDPKEVARIRISGHRHARRFHSTRARASWVMDMIRTHIDIP